MDLQLETFKRYYSSVCINYASAETSVWLEFGCARTSVYYLLRAAIRCIAGLE